MTAEPTLIDISPPVSAASAVWPGDTPVSREVLARRSAGDSVTLSTLHGTVHVGAHADAPGHVVAGAASIDAVPLTAYVGPCVVVDAPVEPRGLVGSEALGELAAPRVLLRTGTWHDDGAGFDQDFAAIHPRLVHVLAELGGVLVGIDTPSVDPFDSKDLPTHNACVDHGVAILEGLDLASVRPGTYELIALPLRLAGFDASPVRAVLRPLAEPAAGQ